MHFTTAGDRLVTAARIEFLDPGKERDDGCPSLTHTHPFRKQSRYRLSNTAPPLFTRLRTAVRRQCRSFLEQDLVTLSTLLLPEDEGRDVRDTSHQRS